MVIYRQLPFGQIALYGVSDCNPVCRDNFLYLQVGVKQQALEKVANEFEVLEKDKEEIQQWISDVKKELSSTGDQEDKNPDVVIRRRKLKVCVSESYAIAKLVNLQTVKQTAKFPAIVRPSMLTLISQ